MTCSLQLQPIPSESSLQQKLQNKTNWEAYKAMTVVNHLLYRKHVHKSAPPIWGWFPVPPSLVIFIVRIDAFHKPPENQSCDKKYCTDVRNKHVNSEPMYCTEMMNKHAVLRQISHRDVKFKTIYVCDSNGFFIHLSLSSVAWYWCIIDRIYEFMMLLAISCGAIHSLKGYIFCQVLDSQFYIMFPKLDRFSWIWTVCV